MGENLSPVSAIEATNPADRIWAYTNARGSRAWTPMKPVIVGAHEEQEYVLDDIHNALARQAEALQRENAELREALKECHAALKMMISPGDISGSTVLGAFAAAKSAEARARALLAATRSGSATTPTGGEHD